MLGFRFPQNFRRPYTAVNLQDFWRRWHITLSFWLRDYLYIPLGGNRGSEWRVAMNILITMLLGGLWHGAAWTFVAWGALPRRRPGHRPRAAGARGRPAACPLDPVGRGRVAWARFVTFQVVCLGWLFFRADTLGDASAPCSVGCSTGGDASPLVTPLAVLAIAAGIASQYLPDDWLDRVQAVFADRRPVVQGGILGLVLLAITTLGPAGRGPVHLLPVLTVRRPCPDQHSGTRPTTGPTATRVCGPVDRPGGSDGRRAAAAADASAATRAPAVPGIPWTRMLFIGLVCFGVWLLLDAPSLQRSAIDLAARARGGRSRWTWWARSPP